MANGCGKSTLAACRCSSTLTCGDCLGSAPPWHFTPSRSLSEWLANQGRLGR